MSDAVLGWLTGRWLFGGRETPPHASTDDRRVRAPRVESSETIPIPPTTDAFAEAIRAGDEVAFQHVFRTYYQKLVAIAQNRLGARDAAEDIVQQALSTLWMNRHRLIGVQEIAPYLFATIRNAALRARQREMATTRVKQAVLSDPLTKLAVIPSEITDEELIDRARVALRSLAPRDQEVIELRLQGLTFAEIGTALGLPLKTVATRTTRAMERLRRVLFDSV